jgi:hypothetical protein
MADKKRSRLPRLMTERIEASPEEIGEGGAQPASKDRLKVSPQDLDGPAHWGLHADSPHPSVYVHRT